MIFLHIFLTKYLNNSISIYYELAITCVLAAFSCLPAGRLVAFQLKGKELFGAYAPAVAKFFSR